MGNISQDIEVYVKDISEDTNTIYKTKGYRRDIYVKYQDKFYNMNVFSLTYLKQFLKNQYELEKIYCLEPNLLIVKVLNFDEIILTVFKATQKHYFDALKECQIENGEIIYSLDEETKECFKKENWAISYPINKLKRIY